FDSFKRSTTPRYRLLLDNGHEPPGPERPGQGPEGASRIETLVESRKVISRLHAHSSYNQLHTRCFDESNTKSISMLCAKFYPYVKFCGDCQVISHGRVMGHGKLSTLSLIDPVVRSPKTYEYRSFSAVVFRAKRG